MTADDQIKRARQVFDIEIEGLRRTRDSIDTSFTEAVGLMLDVVSHDGIVVVSGVGKNLHIAEKMSAIFASTGTRSIVLNPVQAMHGDLGMVSARDVLLALSFSGESEEVIRLIPAIRRHGLKVISMTGNSQSTLAKMSDIHIAIPCGREACPFGMAPTNSTTGERLARVAPTATVMETLLAMTKAQAGSAVIADAEGRLLGIFTDGDFRRVMAQAQDRSGVLGAPVETYMTHGPMFVRDDAYAAELLKVFERRRIDDLPVCDEQGRVVGLVDIQDLPKMKVL